MEKQCVKCNNFKQEIDFSPSQLKLKYSICKKCCSQANKAYREANKEKIKKYDKDRKKSYYQDNKEKILINAKKFYNKEKIKEKNKIYYQKNKQKIINKIKQYNIKNINNIKNYHNNYYKNLRKNNIHYKLRCNISANIYFNIKLSKNKQSILKYLTYSIEDLKKHLESLFEPWMNWDNYGKYNSKTWDDNNVITWTWQIDHIIPQSMLTYSSMEDDNFKKCWSLDNLRPYSSKLNFLDGVSRIRHK